MVAGQTRQQTANCGMGLTRVRRAGPAQVLEKRVKTPCRIAPRGQVMISQQGIRHLKPKLAESGNLVGQHLKHQSRVKFRVVHMPRLQPSVLIMLHQMVVGVARKGQGVQPQCVDRGRAQGSQTRPIGHQMRQIVAQDVMADQMPCVFTERLQTVQPCVQRPAFVRQSLPTPTAHRRKSKNPRRFGIDFQINRNAIR